MPLYNASDINHKWTVQKIANEVFAGYQSGKDPLETLVKAAQSNNLTPELVSSTVHYINNEMFLDHLEKKGSNKIVPIKISDVLEKLGLTEEKVASEEKADILDPFKYWTLESKQPFLKVAEELEYVNEEWDNVKTANQKRNNFRMEGKERTRKAKLEGQIIKLASDLDKMRTKLYNDILFALKREEIEPEKVYALAKVAEDKDLQKSCLGALESYLNPKEGRPNKIDEKKASEHGNMLELSKEVDKYDDSITVTVKTFKGLKNQLSTLIDEYDKPIRGLN